MINTILFATDMGIHTHYLLHHVNFLAGQYDAKVVLVHAIEPPGHLGDAVVKSFLEKDTQQEFEEKGIATIIKGVKGTIVDMLEEEFMDGQQGLSNIREVKVVSGKPADVIISEASAYSADMIIVGSHGSANATPHVLGSVTSKVLKMSRIPVYMVPLLRNIAFYAKAG